MASKDAEAEAGRLQPPTELAHRRGPDGPGEKRLQGVLSQRGNPHHQTTKLRCRPIERPHRETAKKSR